MSLWSDIAVQISASINTPFDVEKTSAISGGCINQAYCIEDDKHSFFVGEYGNAFYKNVKLS